MPVTQKHLQRQVRRPVVSLHTHTNEKDLKLPHGKRSWKLHHFFPLNHKQNLNYLEDFHPV